MRFRSTLVALLILAGLAGYIYYYEFRGEESRAAAETAQKSLLAFEKEKVETLEIARPGTGALTLRRDGAVWTMTAPSLPGEARADGERVESLLSSLGWARIEQKLEGTTDAEKESFKLGQPAATITLKLTGSGEPLVVDVGDKAPLGSNHYAARPGSPDVLLVSGGLESILTADAASLRFKKIIGVDTWKVARLRLEKGGRSLAVARGAEGESWRIESPISFPGDESKIQGIWFDLQGLEALSFEAEQPSAADLRRLGLDPPALTVNVEAKEGAPPVTASFSAPDPNGAVFVRRADMPAVMRVGKEIFEKLDRAVSGAEDLRDHRVAPMDRWKLGGLRIAMPGGELTLEKDAESGRWRLGDKGGPEARSEDVNTLLDAIEALRAESFTDSAPGGDAPIRLTLREGSPDSARSITVNVGAQAPDSGPRRAGNSLTATGYLLPEASVTSLLERAAAVLAPPPPPSGAAADPNAAPVPSHEPPR